MSELKRTGRHSSHLTEDGTVARGGRAGSKFTVQVKVKADPTHEEAERAASPVGDQGQVWKNVC